MIKQKPLAFFIVLVILFSFTLPAVAKTYKIGGIPWVGSSPLDVALVKGFWKKHGVDVKVLSFVEPQKMDDAMAKGLLDIRYDMLGSAIDQIMAGNPYVLIAETDWSNGGDLILVRDGVDKSSLTGKMLGVYMDKPSITFFLNKHLTSWGIGLSDVKIVGMNDEALLDKFNAGLFPAMVHYGPYAMMAVEKGGCQISATSATYPGCIPEGLMMNKEVLAKTPKEDLVNILKGWIDAVNWMNDPKNMAEYIELAKKHTFKAIPEITDQDVKDMFSAVLLHDANTLQARNKTGGGLDSYLTELHSFLAKNELLEKDFKTDEVFDNQIIMEVLN